MKSKLKVIAIGGDSGSGKTTLKHEFMKIMGNDFSTIFSTRHLQFAYYLKYVQFREKYGVNYEESQWFKNSLMTGNVSVREALIKMATETRAKDDAFYAKKLVEQAALVNESVKYIVIDDLRFDIECQTLIEDFDEVFFIRLINGGNRSNRKDFEIKKHIKLFNTFWHYNDVQPIADYLVSAIKDNNLSYLQTDDIAYSPDGDIKIKF